MYDLSFESMNGITKKHFYFGGWTEQQTDAKKKWPCLVVVWYNCYFYTWLVIRKYHLYTRLTAGFCNRNIILTNKTNINKQINNKLILTIALIFKNNVNDNNIHVILFLPVFLSFCRACEWNQRLIVGMHSIFKRIV